LRFSPSRSRFRPSTASSLIRALSVLLSLFLSLEFIEFAVTRFAVSLRGIRRIKKSEPGIGYRLNIAQTAARIDNLRDIRQSMPEASASLDDSQASPPNYLQGEGSR
jgi:hypothetical protein